MKYDVPVTISPDFSFCLTAVSQYILNGQQLRVLNGENYCGEAIDSDAFRLCLDGSEDISAQLAGLTMNATDAGPAVIQSCTALSDPACSGLLYICTLTEDAFEHPQCITNISNGDQTISCSSSACTPDA